MAGRRQSRLFHPISQMRRTESLRADARPCSAVLPSLSPSLWPGAKCFPLQNGGENIPCFLGALRRMPVGTEELCNLLNRVWLS